jgi:hypothetical protein
MTRRSARNAEVGMRGGGAFLQHDAILIPAMLRVLKRVFDAAQADTRAVPGHERRQLLEPGENAALLEQGRAKAQLLRTGKRRQARLRPPGAHPPGREIAHLLYVPNTQSVLARNRARP